MKILLVEDNTNSVETLTRLLERENMSVFSTGNGEDALCIAQYPDIDLILLDLGLPDIHGHEVIRRLRATGSKTPVLVLSGEDNLDSRVYCLRQGADDFLAKPFQFSELLARIFAVTRRSRGYFESEIKVGRLKLQLGKNSVEADGRTLALSNNEYKVLETLLLRAGRLVTKDSLLSVMYSTPEVPDAKILDVYVYRLRKKIDKATEGKSCITTIRGEGFMIAT
ncbi:response regulator transcription factor [Leisingera sp. D0M16]|uniref:response regulator transcription factor n=1 Tax=Leisingera coralii TaxID=3351347 RepID=UPI003B7D5FF4